MGLAAPYAHQANSQPAAFSHARMLWCPRPKPLLYSSFKIQDIFRCLPDAQAGPGIPFLSSLATWTANSVSALKTPFYKWLVMCPQPTTTQRALRGQEPELGGNLSPHHVSRARSRVGSVMSIE